MKKLTCEMCGSTDLIKEGGVFVCQTCGCKYSVEEARKMMIEGTVEVQGTVQVDNSNYVKKYMENARRARAKEDWEETEKYYNMVEQNDPNNIEAIFYSAYAKAKTALIDNDIYKREAAFKVLKNCISIIDDNYDPSRRQDNEEAIASIAQDLGAMICGNFVYSQTKNGYGMVTSSTKGTTLSLFGGLLDAFRESIKHIAQIDDQVFLHTASSHLYRMALLTNYWPSDLLNRWIDEEMQAIGTLGRRDAEIYWANHPDELAEVKAQRIEICNQISSLQEESVATKKMKISENEEKIKQLYEELNGISVFKLKARITIENQIEKLQLEMGSLHQELNSIENAMNEELEPLHDKLRHLDHILEFGN